MPAHRPPPALGAPQHRQAPSLHPRSTEALAASRAQPSTVIAWTPLWGSSWKPAAEHYKARNGIISEKAAERMARRAAEQAAEQQRVQAEHARRRKKAHMKLADLEERAAQALHSSWSWMQPFELLRLTNLDRRLRDALASKQLRLLRSDWLLSLPAGSRLPRRQALELLEMKGDLPFLSPNEATCWLETGRRHIGALSAGWLSHPHPDPDGIRLAALQRFLGADKQIVGLFWDYASLPMRPRTPAEDFTFGAGLAVMADLYASAVGTATLVMVDVPPRPARFDGAVYIGGLSADGSPTDETRSQLHNALAGFGAIVELRLAESGESALVRFEKHAQARLAVAMGQANVRRAVNCVSVWLATYYNERPAASRGWMVFEQAMSAFAVDQISQLPKTREKLEALERPKILRIAANGRSWPLATGDIASGSTHMASCIERAHFSVPSDAAVLLDRYAEYAVDLSRVLDQARADADGLMYETVGGYSGERNARGEPDGVGSMEINGELYIGQIRAGEREGEGTQRFRDGSVYKGAWTGGKRHGYGTLTAANGQERYVGMWHEGMRHGDARHQLLRVSTVHDGLKDHGDGGGGGGEGEDSVGSVEGGTGSVVTQDVVWTRWETVWCGQYLYDKKKIQRRADHQDAPSALRAALNAIEPELSEPSDAMKAKVAGKSITISMMGGRKGERQRDRLRMDG